MNPVTANAAIRGGLELPSFDPIGDGASADAEEMCNLGLAIESVRLDHQFLLSGH